MYFGLLQCYEEKNQDFIPSQFFQVTKSEENSESESQVGKYLLLTPDPISVDFNKTSGPLEQCTLVGRAVLPQIFANTEKRRTE